MTGIETAYLGLVVGAAMIFIVTLAGVAWWTDHD
jgi:hypothetical protein